MCSNLDLWVSLSFNSSLPQLAWDLFLVLQDWWRESEDRVPQPQKKGFNSLVILVAWQIWKHRNTCVFEAASPYISKILHDIHDEAVLWGMAGGRGL